MLAQVSLIDEQISIIISESAAFDNVIHRRWRIPLISRNQKANIWSGKDRKSAQKVIETAYVGFNQS
jgi:hypothetical protein